MLTDAEKQNIQHDVVILIIASGEETDIYRPTLTGEGSFSGPHTSSQDFLSTVAIEFKQLSPEELKQIGADGVCAMHPTTDVKEGDIVVYDGNRYVVTNVKPENFFGVITHLIVKLEREYAKNEP